MATRHGSPTAAVHLQAAPPPPLGSRGGQRWFCNAQKSGLSANGDYLTIRANCLENNFPEIGFVNGCPWE
jgi:hypothetical protein